MVLRDGITLSKKHQRKFNVFPYFFRPALNHFYFLKNDYGFLKPKLDTWKNEGSLEFESKGISITIQFATTHWISVCFTKKNIPGRLYETDLFRKLDISFEENLIKVNWQPYDQGRKKEYHEIEKDIEKCFEYLSSIMQDNLKGKRKS